jgi:hypothetical protein
MQDKAGCPFSRRERWRKADPEKRVRALRCAEGEDLVAVVLAFVPDGAAGAAADILRDLLAHDAPRVRAAALRAWASGPEALAAADVRAAVAHPDSRVRAAGLYTLRLRPSLAGADGCRDLLPALLADDDTNIRFMMVELAQRLGGVIPSWAIAAGLEDDARLDRVGCFAAPCRALRALTGQDVPGMAAPRGDIHVALRLWRLEQAARWRRLLGL